MCAFKGQENYKLVYFVPFTGITKWKTGGA